MAHGTPAAYLTFPGLAAAGLPHATTTRYCPGVTPPTEAGAPFTDEAAAMLARAGLTLSRVAWARQVHGAGVAGAPSGGGFAGSADVLTATERGVPLAVFTADCLAVVLWDPDAWVLAVAHVGWRGTVRGATQAAVRATEGLGARARRLRVAIGPSIGPCCYEVDEPVVAEFARAYPRRWEAWVSPGHPNRPGRVMLDLWAANEALLEEAGVSPALVENPRLCTASNPALLYSYRTGHRGRLVTLAALP